MTAAEPEIAWRDLVRFVGQLTHDIRNHLNALELQSAFLAEVIEEPEGKAEVARLREVLGETSADLQKLTRLLAPVKATPIRYRAKEFVEDLRGRLTKKQTEQASAVEWRDSLGDEALEVDPTLLLEAFEELFANAFAHGRAAGRLIFEARASGAQIEFLLREPKEQLELSTGDWGRPLAKMSRGHYALGLHRARSIFQAHHGSFQAHFDPAAATLTTTVALPRATA